MSVCSIARAARPILWSLPPHVQCGFCFTGEDLGAWEGQLPEVAQGASPPQGAPLSVPPAKVFPLLTKLSHSGKFPL